MPDKMKLKTIVRAATHPSDTRPNIPTAELESFARPEEKRPTIVRYPRDTTLDPQLVWIDVRYTTLDRYVSAVSREKARLTIGRIRAVGRP